MSQYQPKHKRGEIHKPLLPAASRYHLCTMYGGFYKLRFKKLFMGEIMAVCPQCGKVVRTLDKPSTVKTRPYMAWLNA